MKQHRRNGFIICFSVMLLALLIYVLGGFDALELKTVDFRFYWRGDRPANQDIVVIKVDEASIDKLGRWPWPREFHGRLTRSLKKAGAKVVSFDSLFTEPDKNYPASDRALAKAGKDTQIMVSAFFFKGGIHDGIFATDPLYPYPDLAENSMIGFVNLDPDADGVTRRAALYYLEDEGNEGRLTLHPSLAVATLALSRGISINELLPELPIVIDTEDLSFAKNNLFINYAFEGRGEYAYPTYSFAEVLEGNVDMEKSFKDKIVFVGATAVALFDLKAIPLISKHPGVMVHANVIDNLISKNYLENTPLEFTIFYILIIGLFLGYFFPRLSILKMLFLFLGVVVGGLLFAQYLFSARNMVIPMVPPLFTGFASYGGILFYRLVIEEKEKRKIKGSFKQYLSPKIIDVMTKDPSKLKLGGEEREVTIFFLDIAGFTTMSEALNPSQLVEVMNECLTEFSNIILKHDGLINKYIGDCIMAFWNSPVDQPRHAALACLAGLDCLKALPKLNERFKSKGLPSIDCRIGINTGTVVVGNMGSHEKFDYTVMGDPVNLASRLEGANKQYHSRIMVSEATFEHAKDEIEARDLDLIRVKGKKEPKKVFEILCRKGEMSEALEHGRKKYHEALRMYRQKNFEEAVHTLQEVFDYLPNDHLTLVYLERARTFKITPPPPNWDGVFEMKTK